jgi:hypothetical protein
MGPVDFFSSKKVGVLTNLLLTMCDETLTIAKEVEEERRAALVAQLLSN